MHIPLAIFDSGPSRTAKHRLPVIGWQLTVFAPAIFEVVVGALVRARCCLEGLLKPLVLGRGVIGDQVNHDPDA